MFLPNLKFPASFDPEIIAIGVLGGVTGYTVTFVVLIDH